MMDTTAVTLVALTLLREAKREVAKATPAELEEVGKRARVIAATFEGKGARLDRWLAGIP